MHKRFLPAARSIDRYSAMVLPMKAMGAKKDMKAKKWTMVTPYPYWELRVYDDGSFSMAALYRSRDESGCTMMMSVSQV